MTKPLSCASCIVLLASIDPISPCPPSQAIRIAQVKPNLRRPRPLMHSTLCAQVLEEVPRCTVESIPHRRILQTPFCWLILDSGSCLCIGYRGREGRRPGCNRPRAAAAPGWQSQIQSQSQRDSCSLSVTPHAIPQTDLVLGGRRAPQQVSIYVHNPFGSSPSPSSLHGHYAQNRHNNDTALVLLVRSLRPADQLDVAMMMTDAGEDAAFLEPENPIPWRTPPLFNAAAHAPSQVHTHASSIFHLSAQARRVVDVQPHTPPLPFVFYDEDIISDNSAARVPIFTDIIQQTPSLINTLSSHPAYAGVPFPHNVYSWGIYTFSSASQGHGHSNCPDPKSPEDCILISPQSSAEPPNRPLPLMDIAAITTRAQPGRLWSDSTNSEPSAISRHQITGSPEDCSALDADGPPDARRSKRKRQLESNRKAAKKCRQKVKDQEKGLEDREKQCKELNSVLHAQASALKDEVLSLKNEILSHSGCDCVLIKQYISSSAMEIFQNDQ